MPLELDPEVRKELVKRFRRIERNLREIESIIDREFGAKPRSWCDEKPGLIRLADHVASVLEVAGGPLTVRDVAMKLGTDQGRVRVALMYYSDRFIPDRSQPNRVLWSIRPATPDEGAKEVPDVA